MNIEPIELQSKQNIIKQLGTGARHVPGDIIIIAFMFIALLTEITDCSSQSQEAVRDWQRIQVCLQHSGDPAALR